MLCKVCGSFYGAVAEDLLLVNFLSGMLKSTELLRVVLLRSSEGTGP